MLVLALAAAGLIATRRKDTGRHLIATRRHAVELRDRGFTVIPDAGFDTSLVADARAACSRYATSPARVRQAAATAQNPCLVPLRSIPVLIPASVPASLLRGRHCGAESSHAFRMASSSSVWTQHATSTPSARSRRATAAATASSPPAPRRGRVWSTPRSPSPRRWWPSYTRCRRTPTTACLRPRGCTDGCRRRPRSTRSTLSSARRALRPKSSTPTPARCTSGARG